MEKLNPEKIAGYFLLAIGLIIISYSAINVINVFRGKTQPVNLFNFDSISIDLGSAFGLPPQQGEIKQELVQKEMINKPVNIAAHLFLMGFLVTVGFRISQLGILLARPVKVHLLRKGDYTVQN